ncbi:MAG: RNA-binding domain-containing protein [Cyanobacteriota bacterium]
MNTQEIIELIAQDENEQLEFKSSARWDYKLAKINKDLQDVIIKAISAFMNTEGGNLLIGVDDSGNILGLENDYKTLPKKNKDGFELNIRNLISENFGSEISPYIKIKFYLIDDKEICIVSVPLMDKPIYFKDNLCIRNGNSIRTLSTKEAVNYYLNKWQNNDKKDIDNRFFQFFNIFQNLLSRIEDKGKSYKEKIILFRKDILSNPFGGYSNRPTLLTHFEDNYLRLKNEFILYISSFFNLINFIDENILPKDDKKIYAEIIKSHLSDYEMILIIFYLIFEKNKNHYGLVEKYNLLEKLSLNESEEYFFEEYEIWNLLKENKI